MRDSENSKVHAQQPRGELVPQFNNRNGGLTRHGVDDGYESEEGDCEQYDKGRNLHDQHPAVIDEDYLVVGNYVKEHIRQRIENGEYVDFSRLLPRDRLAFEDETRMEIVNRNGRTFFVPANDTDVGSISNFSRWEQAFRVYSNIYTRRYPGRAYELIQYNHVIHTAALSYTWENVYLYDCDFRLHLSRYPHHSWAVILQQAWSMRLKDWNRHDQKQGGQGPNGGPRGKSGRSKDICWRYNAGRCTFGSSCKFKHRCAICNKFGHGAHICRKANIILVMIRTRTMGEATLGQGQELEGKVGTIHLIITTIPTAEKIMTRKSLTISAKTIIIIENNS